MSNYLIDAYWLKPNSKVKGVLFTQNALKAIAALIGLLTGLFLGVVTQSIGIGFTMFFLIFAFGILTSQYAFRRKSKGYIRFTTQHIYLKEKQTQRFNIQLNHPLHIDFNFDERLSHRIWLTQASGEKLPILFEFIQEKDVRKFRYWLKIIAKQGIAIAPQTLESIERLPIPKEIEAVDDFGGDFFIDSF